MNVVINEFEVVQKIAEEGKHTFISTGMTSYEDIDRAVEIFKQANCPFELMHTVSTYPMKIEHANLITINQLRNEAVSQAEHLATSYSNAINSMEQDDIRFVIVACSIN